MFLFEANLEFTFAGHSVTQMRAGLLNAAWNTTLRFTVQFHTMQFMFSINTDFQNFSSIKNDMKESGFLLLYVTYILFLIVGEDQ